MKEMLKKALSLVLVACLAFGICSNGLIVLATDDGDQETEINYVSLGDSMTNGYGLPGYDGNTGVEDYGNGSYANLFAEWLAEQYDVVNHAQLAMSAMRAEDLHWLLEVHYEDEKVLEVIETLAAEGWNEELWYSVFTNGDYWTWDELVNNYRFDIAAYCIEGNDNGGAFDPSEVYGEWTDVYTDVEALQIVAKYYQDSVAAGDILSLGMGNGNFGVFMFGRILEAIGFSGDPANVARYDLENAIRECDPDLQAEIRDLVDILYNAVETYLGRPIYEEGKSGMLADVVVYTAVSYVLNYAGSVEAILQRNPDAEIILVALMNTYADETEVEGISIGKLLDVVFKPLNTFIAALPTYMQAVDNGVYADAKFYFAEADDVECLVEVYGEDFDEWFIFYDNNYNGVYDGSSEDVPRSSWISPTIVNNSTIRDRFLESIVGEPIEDENWDRIGWTGMVWNLLFGVELVPGCDLSYVKMENIYKAETSPETWQNQYLSYRLSMDVYLAFEEAILESKDAAVTLDSILGLGNMSADLFSGVMANINVHPELYFEEELMKVAEDITPYYMVNYGFSPEQILGFLVSDDPSAGKAAILAAAAPQAKFDNLCTLVYQYNEYLSALVYADAYEAIGDYENAEYLLEMAESYRPVAEIFEAHLTEWADWFEIYSYDPFDYIDELAGQYLVVGYAPLESGADYSKPYYDQFAACDCDACMAWKNAVVYDWYGDPRGTNWELMQASLEQTIAVAPNNFMNAYNDCRAEACMHELRPALVEALLADETVCGLLALFARCVIGNGLGGHPSADGHGALAEALITAYDEDYTAKDEIISKVDIINRYVKGLYSLVTNILDKNLKDVAVDLKADLEVLYTELEAEALALNKVLEDLTNEEKAILADMMAERDALVAELAELEAELERIQNGQRTRGNNSGTPKHDAAVAELEAAIAETEAAIAELDASIEALNARIEANLNGMTEIKAAVDALKAQIADTIAAVAEVEAAAGKLNTDLIALQDAINVLGKLVGMDKVDAKEVVAAVKTLIVNLPSIVEDIKNVYDATVDAIEKAQAAADAVANFAGNIQDEVDAIVNGVEDLAGIEAEKLEAIKAAVAVFEEKVNAFVNENRPAVEEALKNTYVDMEALVQAQLVKFETKWEENKDTIMTLLGFAYFYCQEKGYIEDAKELAREYADMVRDYLDNMEQKLGEAQNWLDENLPKTEAELKAELAKIEEQLRENLTAEQRAALEAAKAEVLAKLDALYALAENVQEQIAAIKAYIVAVRTAVDNVVVAAQTVGTDLVALGNALCNLMNEMKELSGAVVDLHDAVVEEIKILVGLVGNVAEDFVAVIETLANYVALLDHVPGVLAEVLYNATHADYEISEDSYYVAIGDSSAISESYVDLLAKELGLGERFANLAQDGLTVDQAFAVIMEEAAELAKADLVTVGFNNVAATTNMMLAFGGMSTVDTNWSELIGEYSEYVEEALFEIKAELVKNGLDEKTVSDVANAINAYAYTFAAREFAYPELVNQIHEINPEALVIIVGSYNDLAGVSLTIGETEIAIGEYVQYLITAANLQNLVYAVLTENTIYVDAPAVETLYVEALANGEMIDTGIAGFIAAAMVGYLNPSEAGHEYIKTQILNALNVTRAGMLGDVDGDWDVDNVDAMLILQYDALLLTKEDLDLTVGDVNGDGEVDNVDAMLILQYDAELISAFPAEK